jgi:hypothetical protein
MYAWNVRLISKKVKERNFINLSSVEKDGAFRLDVVPFPPHPGNPKKVERFNTGSVPELTISASAVVTLQPQGMPQSCINVAHWKCLNNPVNFSFGNSSQIISHDNRIREQTRLPSFKCRARSIRLVIMATITCGSPV